MRNTKGQAENKLQNKAPLKFNIKKQKQKPERALIISRQLKCNVYVVLQV